MTTKSVWGRRSGYSSSSSSSISSSRLLVVVVVVVVVVVAVVLVVLLVLESLSVCLLVCPDSEIMFNLIMFNTSPETR